VPLAGTYELLYSMAPGGSNGKVGPLVGRVTQIINDEVRFINQVSLLGGALVIALHAERKVLDDSRIRVSFVETAVSLFGQEVTRRPTKGAGVWEQLHVETGSDGTAKLRVMRTPSLFVLRQVGDEQPLPSNGARANGVSMCAVPEEEGRQEAAVASEAEAARMAKYEKQKSLGASEEYVPPPSLAPMLGGFAVFSVLLLGLDLL